MTDRFRYSPAIARRVTWAATGSPERSGDYPSQPFRQSRRTDSHRSCAIAGVDRFPRGTTPRRRAVPEGKIRTIALTESAFAAVRNPAEAFSRRLRLPTPLALAFAAVRSWTEVLPRRLRPPVPAAVLPAFPLRALLRFRRVRRPFGAVSQRRLKPHRLQKSCLLFKGLRLDPQWLSCFRPVKAAPRNRVAQALISRVIHTHRLSCG